MMKKIKERIKNIFKKPINIGNNISDFSFFEKQVINSVSSYTMTGPDRIVSLLRAVDYIVKNNISGAIVECGVWKGGSVMAAILALKKSKSIRDIYLYDTFEGMTKPTNVDFSYNKESASEIYKNKKNEWCYSSLEDVKKNVKSLDYIFDKVQFVPGKVEDTIPNVVPESIALLRLDTDWYESTKHELEFLFPKLVKGGVLIIDDYGHWKGCKKAVDEYFERNNIVFLLNRVDYTCRIGVKI